MVRRLLAPGAMAIGSFAVVACTYEFDAFTSAGAGGGETGGISASNAGTASSNGGSSGAAITVAGGDGGRSEIGGEGGAGATDEGSAGTTGEGGAGAPGGGSGGATGDGGEPSASAGDDGAGGSGTTGGNGSGGNIGAAGQNATGGGPASFDCKAVSGTLWNDHCYFLTSVASPWLAASTACNESVPSAHLVTIADADEEQMLEANFLDNAGADRWIGLSLANTDVNPPGSCKIMPDQCPFSWVTDEPLAYTKWGAHSANDVEPNYTGACVRIRRDSRDWADLDCSDRLTAICEVD